jgi:purine-nucleoside phosphorylase
MDGCLRIIKARAPAAKPRIGIILGSGWGTFSQHVQVNSRMAYSELPGFPNTEVQGHGHELLLGRVGAKEVAVLTGRKHAYETGEPTGMKLPIRTLRALGCEVLLQTNAAGSLRAHMSPGSLMMISDHINLSQRSALIGEPGNEKFVNMTDAYDPALRAQAQMFARQQQVTLHEGVYIWYVGPQFETPAEIRLFAQLGADAVGMSTVPETIIARHAGMRVMALSLLTNMAAGLSHEHLSHAHTLAQANSASEQASAFLAGLVAALDV